MTKCTHREDSTFLEDGKGRNTRPMGQLMVYFMFVQSKYGLQVVIENSGTVAV
jgi:hypothetical protein